MSLPSFLNRNGCYHDREIGVIFHELRENEFVFAPKDRGFALKLRLIAVRNWRCVGRPDHCDFQSDLYLVNERFKVKYWMI